MKNRIFVRKKKLHEENLLKGMGYGQAVPVFEVVTEKQGEFIRQDFDGEGNTWDVTKKSYETHFVERKNPDSAKVRASKYGSVLSCQKVDPFYFLYKIEFLNLKQTPMVVEIGNSSITTNNTLEIQKPATKNKFEIVIDKE
jgi:hypothetical protein